MTPAQKSLADLVEPNLDLYLKTSPGLLPPTAPGSKTEVWVCGVSSEQGKHVKLIRGL